MVPLMRLPLLEKVPVYWPRPGRSMTMRVAVRERMRAKLVSLPESLPGVWVQVASKLLPSERRVQTAVQTLELVPEASTTCHLLPVGPGVLATTEVAPAGALSVTVHVPGAQLWEPVMRLRSAEKVPVYLPSPGRSMTMREPDMETIRAKL